MNQNKPYGCLALLFGIGANRRPASQPPRTTQPARPPIADEMDDNMEGDIHSGPGGYEGMGYAGGYAADYFADEDEEGKH